MKPASEEAKYIAYVNRWVAPGVEGRLIPILERVIIEARLEGAEWFRDQALKAIEEQYFPWRDEPEHPCDIIRVLPLEPEADNG